MDYENAFFISYAHADNQSEDGKSGFVDIFYEKLCKSEEHQRLFGKDMNVFFDKSDIPNMSDWDNRIQSGLAKSRFLIVLISPNYFKSEYCAREFEWWMRHEMHRCTLGEGTATMLIYDVASLQDSKMKTIPAIPAKLQARYPNWLKQIRKIQSDHKFDMHDFLIAKIDDALLTLRDEVKDKVRHQDIVNQLPYDTYPGYNENFVGRRKNLFSLRNYLSTKNGKVISALTGLGGFGKTEMALTYGHAFGWDYKLGRFFKPCENCKSIYEALLTCGIQDKYGWKPEGTPEEQLQEIFERLREEQENIIAKNTEPGIPNTEGAHALIILDNVNLDNENNDEPNLISQLLALSNLPEFIHIIITTRENTDEFTDVYTASVERLSEEESVELLSSLRPFSNQTEAQVARKIAQLLAGFTLIVELTGAYLARKKKNPLVTYKTQYDKLVANHAETFEKMANETGYLKRHAAQSVAAVIESPLSAITDNTRNALEFASLMSPDAVALSWLPELCGLDEDEGEVILDELTGYSLVTPLKSEPNIGRIHRLVAETVKQEIPEDVKKEILTKIREKCNELLHKDKTFWYSSENSWNITPVSEFCLALAEQWTVESSEESIDWNLTRMFDSSGNMLRSLGKMDDARKVFQRCYEIRKERVKTFSESVDVQRDLNASYHFLGSIEIYEGNTIVAREFFEEALEISKRLADMVPDDINVQRDLGASYNRLGYLENLVGNTLVAQDLYEKALEICKKLADWMPDNINAQQDLSDSYNNLGNLEKATRNAAAARNWFERALEISKRLAERMPDNVDAQRDLSASYNNLSDLEKAAGKLETARYWFEKALEISKRLADRMQDNVQAQLDLIASNYRLGDLEKAAGNAAAAREHYENALEIRKCLADKMPDNVDAQRDLSRSYKDLGDLENAARNVVAARDLYEKALEILLRLADKMPEDFLIQHNLSALYTSFGALECHSGKYNIAHKWFEKALEIIQPFAEKSPEYVSLQKEIEDLKSILFHSIPRIVIAKRCLFVSCIVIIVLLVIMLIKRFFF